MVGLALVTLVTLVDVRSGTVGVRLVGVSFGLKGHMVHLWRMLVFAVVVFVGSRGGEGEGGVSGRERAMERGKEWRRGRGEGGGDEVVEGEDPLLFRDLLSESVTLSQLGGGGGGAKASGSTIGGGNSVAFLGVVSLLPNSLVSRGWWVTGGGVSKRFISIISGDPSNCGKSQYDGNGSELTANCREHIGEHRPSL